MADVPSIKGSIFLRGVEDLRKLLSDGRLSQTELEARLEPGDLVHLREPVHMSSWYAVASYGRILEVLKEVEGAGSNEYLRRRGTESAEALLEAGMYQQLEYLSRTQVAEARGAEERFRAFGRDLKLLVSLHGTLLNFGVQTAKADPEHPDRYLLEIAQADPYPEPLIWTTDGFINRMARQHRNRDLWTWSRPRRDLVVFRMTRSL